MLAHIVLPQYNRQVPDEAFLYFQGKSILELSRDFPKLNENYAHGNIVDPNEH
jgi:hypothetical protein